MMDEDTKDPEQQIDEEVGKEEEEEADEEKPEEGEDDSKPKAKEEDTDEKKEGEDQSVETKQQGPCVAPYGFPQWGNYPQQFAAQAYYAQAPFMGAGGVDPPDPIPDTHRNRGGVTEPFPEKLHRMLETCEREGKGDVASFFKHGRAFAIHKPRRFVAEVMPRFFRQSKLTSFQRQLNLYGFKRISSGIDNGGYWHPFFLKGRPRLCVNMKRQKVKGGGKKASNPNNGPVREDPNFYSFPPIKDGSKADGEQQPGPQGFGAPPHGYGGFPPQGGYPPYGYPPNAYGGYPGWGFPQYGAQPFHQQGKGPETSPVQRAKDEGDDQEQDDSESPSKEKSPEETPSKDQEAA